MGKRSRRKGLTTTRADGTTYTQDRPRITPGSPEHLALVQHVLADVAEAQDRTDRLDTLQGRR